VPAVEAAAEILMLGGSAIDAAIAAAFVQGVVDPIMCGPGGYAVLLHRSASGTASVVDGSARAGSLVRPDQWADISLGPTIDRFGYRVAGNVNEVGYQSIAVPGTVDALGVAHARWGTIPWSLLLEPAIAIAAEGFVVTESTTDFWRRPATEGRTSGPDRLRHTEASARQFAPAGEPLAPGERLVQPDHAGFLRTLAREGARALYEGDVANVIASNIQEHGGFVTADDLASFRARFLEPISTRYRGVEVIGAPPPFGGVLVAQVLSILDRFMVGALVHGSADHLAVLAEAMKVAGLQRGIEGADPAVAAEVGGGLAWTQRTAAIVESLRAQHEWIDNIPVEPPDTTQLCVVDRNGEAVSLTHSLGYSSGVVIPTLGFLLNNYMNCFNPLPGHCDSIAPGKHRDSSMAPTLVTKAGRLTHVVGAPGATRIPGAIAQVLVNTIDFGMSPVEAVSAPRIDCQGGAIHAEGRIRRSVVAALEARGYEVEQHPTNYDRYFARPQLLMRSADGWDGASDPRGDGAGVMYAG
jgi:gamma-glutamyltranspeptidase/glutathione hydrolase